MNKKLNTIKTAKKSVYSFFKIQILLIIFCFAFFSFNFSSITSPFIKLQKIEVSQDHKDRIIKLIFSKEIDTQNIYFKPMLVKKPPTFILLFLDNISSSISRESKINDGFINEIKGTYLFKNNEKFLDNIAISTEHLAEYNFKYKKNVLQISLTPIESLKLLDPASKKSVSIPSDLEEKKQQGIKSKKKQELLSNKKEITALFKKAHKAYKAKQYKDALIHYNNILHNDPSNKKANNYIKKIDSLLKKEELNKKKQLEKEQQKEKEKLRKKKEAQAKKITQQKEKEEFIKKEKEKQAKQIALAAKKSEIKNRKVKINTLLKEAYSLFKKKQYSDAKKAYDQIVTLDPKNKSAHNYISKIEIILKKEALKKIPVKKTI
ncbi:hypothetical protein ACFL1T_04620, partial [Chlamydiota bacterium]